MAKTTIWNGATSGDWEVAGNWSNGQPAYIASPGPYDTVYHSTTATNAMATNLDRTGDGAGNGLHLALFETHEDVLDDIGASGAELKLTAEKFVHRGRGTLYLEAKSGTDASDMLRLIVDSEGGAVIANASGSDLTFVELLAGDIDVTLNEDATYIHLAKSQRWGVPLVVAVSGAGNTAQISMLAGTLAYSATGAATIVNLGAGEFTYTSPAADIDQITLSGGAFFFDGTGTVTTSIIMAGVYDTTRTPGTKTSSFVHRWPAASFIVNDDFVTISTDIEIGEN